MAWTRTKCDTFPVGATKRLSICTRRGVRGLGGDTASIDPGNSTTFDAHRVFLKADKYLVENIKLDEENSRALPEAGGTILIMPIPIENGSEAPARIIAYPSDSSHFCLRPRRRKSSLTHLGNISQ